MKSSAAFLLVCSYLLLAAAPRRAHAEQFVALDLTYEATSANTMNSHFTTPPMAGIPQNWRSPINYANGSAHVRFEVITKPSAAKTLYNICFENTAMSCLPYAPTYTATGVYTFSAQFSAFWQYTALDWTKPITTVALILKNESETKVQGNADFYPYKTHITITIVAPGSTYVPPDTTGMPSNMAGSGVPVAGRGSAGAGARGGAGGAGEGGAGRASATGGAGAAAPTPDAGPEPEPDAAIADAAVDQPAEEPPSRTPRTLDPQAPVVDKRAPPPGDLEAGCALGRNRGSANLIFVTLAAVTFTLRRRRRKPAALRRDQAALHYGPPPSPASCNDPQLA